MKAIDYLKKTNVSEKQIADILGLDNPEVPEVLMEVLTDLHLLKFFYLEKFKNECH